MYQVAIALLYRKSASVSYRMIQYRGVYSEGGTDCCSSEQVSLVPQIKAYRCRSQYMYGPAISIHWETRLLC